jgi:hypothetical protein
MSFEHLVNGSGNHSDQATEIAEVVNSSDNYKLSLIYEVIWE